MLAADDKVMIGRRHVDPAWLEAGAILDVEGGKRPGPCQDLGQAAPAPVDMEDDAPDRGRGRI